MNFVNGADMLLVPASTLFTIQHLLTCARSVVSIHVHMHSCAITALSHASTSRIHAATGAER
jgi:hypothetical protein